MAPKQPEGPLAPAWPEPCHFKGSRCRPGWLIHTAQRSPGSADAIPCQRPLQGTTSPVDKQPRPVPRSRPVQTRHPSRKAAGRSETST